MSDLEPISNDFLRELPDEQQTRRQSIFVAVVFTFIIAIVVAVGSAASYRSVLNGTSVLAEVGNLPIISGVRHAVFGAEEIQASSTTPQVSNRMNIMFFGIGGDGHEGSQLTDTIILVSVDKQNKQVGMLSIPRDTAYPLGGGRFEKINSLQAYAEQDHPGEGAQRASKALGELLDVPVDHYVKVDFRGFQALIDALGGVEVTVERSFTDPQYPTADKKWKTVSFKRGKQTMDGETALMYARSRHGSNGEGSDFARSKRQQILIMAIRNKMLSLGTLADPKKLANIYTAVSKHVQSDLSVWDAIGFAPMLEDFSSDRVAMHVLTDAPDGELVPGNVGGAFMLFPKKSDWSAIREIARNPFISKEQREEQERPQQTVKLEIRNGTLRTGFAAQIAAQLEQQGYEIYQFGNAQKKGLEKTIIYDFTSGKKSQELSKLKNSLLADVALSQETLTERHATSTDFLIILGEASYAQAP